MRIFFETQTAWNKIFNCKLFAKFVHFGTKKFFIILTFEWLRCKRGDWLTLKSFGVVFFFWRNLNAKCWPLGGAISLRRSEAVPLVQTRRLTNFEKFWCSRYEETWMRNFDHLVAQWVQEGHMQCLWCKRDDWLTLRSFGEVVLKKRPCKILTNWWRNEFGKIIRSAFGANEAID